MKTKLRTCFAAPGHRSPTSARLMSFSTMTGIPVFCCSISRRGTCTQSERLGAERTKPSATSVIPGAPAVRCKIFLIEVWVSRHMLFSPPWMSAHTASGVFWFLSIVVDQLERTVPLRSASIMRSRVPPISAAATSPWLALKRRRPGGRPPLDSPSPIDSTSPRLSRWATPLETVGALRPESRTKSALEQGLYWRRRCNSPRTFDWRKCEGREGEDCTSVVKVLDIRFSRCLCEALMTPPSYPKYIKKLYKDLGCRQFTQKLLPIPVTVGRSVGSPSQVMLHSF